MRRFLSVVMASCAILPAIRAGEGVPTRASSSDYPVHRDAQNATIAAAPVTPDVAKKMFPSDLYKHYAIIEVAFFPIDGQTVYIDSFDFDLKYSAGEVSYSRNPEEIVAVWSEKGAPQPPRKVDVTTETGVVYTSGRDPATGRSRGLETYTGVSIGAGQPDPPAPLSADPQAFEARLRAKALPEGAAVRPVAGYLYFALPRKKDKSVPLELQYIKDGVLVSLPIPSK